MILKQHILIVAVLLFASLVVLPAAAAAQSRPNPPARPNLGPTSDAVRDMRERDMNVRRLELEKERVAKPTFEVSKETTRQVNEDFARIQSINAEIMHDYATGVAPDYRHISEVMADISKRAARLNANLLLPSNDEEANDRASEVTSDKRQVRSPLLDLNDFISSFVTNPIFKNSNTIDLDLGKRAKRDLLSIIDLSDRISKSAAKLSKTTEKHD